MRFTERYSFHALYFNCEMITFLPHPVDFTGCGIPHPWGNKCSFTHAYDMHSITCVWLVSWFIRLGLYVLLTLLWGNKCSLTHACACSGSLLASAERDRTERERLERRLEGQLTLLGFFLSIIILDRLFFFEMLSLDQMRVKRTREVVCAWCLLW